MAPDGYAVGALNVEGQSYVSAIQPVYMRIKSDGRLAPDDHQNGRWIGFRAPAHLATLTGEGAPVIGIHMRRGIVLDSLALVLDRNRGPAAASQTLSEHTDRVWAVAFSPDGSLLASGGDDGTICLWKPRAGYAQQQKLAGHSGRVRGLTFSPDSAMLASAGFDKTIRLWDANTGENKAIMPDTALAYYPAFIKNGTLLVTGSEEHSARLWDVAQRKLDQPLKGHRGTAWAVAASDASKLIATGGPDPAIRLWRDDGKFVRVLSKRPSGVHALAFTPDGKWLATACGDGVVRLWNTESAELHTTYRGSGLSLAFSPDGKNLVVGCADSSVRVWQLEDTP